MSPVDDLEMVSAAANPEDHVPSGPGLPSCPDPARCEHRMRHHAGPWSCEFNHPRAEARDAGLSDDEPIAPSGLAQRPGARAAA